MNVKQLVKKVSDLLNYVEGLDASGSEEIGLDDAFENPLRIGDIVTYPVRLGSDMWMAIGEVAGRKERDLVVTVCDINGELRTAYVKRLDRVVKIR